MDFTRRQKKLKDTAVNKNILFQDSVYLFSFEQSNCVRAAYSLFLLLPPIDSFLYARRLCGYLALQVQQSAASSRPLVSKRQPSQTFSKMNEYEMQLHLRCRNSIVTREFYRLILTPRMSRIFLGKN